jgi:Protein of unknown function (DUF2752)
MVLVGFRNRLSNSIRLRRPLLCGCHRAAKTLNYPARLPRLLSGLVIVAIACAYLYAFDPRSTAPYPQCLFWRTTGLLCPGCGSARALHALLHLQVAAALHFNPFAVVLVPSLVAAALMEWVSRTPTWLTRLSPWVTWFVIASLVVFAVLRNMGAPTRL